MSFPQILPPEQATRPSRMQAVQVYGFKSRI